MKLKVNEIFYSLQGEGARSGEASVFIRLALCNRACSFCDTDFENSKEMTAGDIYRSIKSFPSRWIIWTGGEPTLQLNDEILLFFKEKGYFQAIESNGTCRFSELLDYTVCSPKGDDLSYAKILNEKVDEVRLPLSEGSALPDIGDLPQAEHYFLSPIITENGESNKKNTDYCIKMALEHPRWALSVQLHKLIGIK